MVSSGSPTLDNTLCEICGEKSDMDFNYMVPSGYSFEPEVSDNPHIFQADICLECFGKAASDSKVVVLVARKRKEGMANGS